MYVPDNLSATQVSGQTTTSFKSEREGWDVKKAVVRTTLSIDTDSTVYTAYIDFDNLLWVAQFWQNDKMLTETTW